MPGPYNVLLAGIILIISGVVATVFGLGLLPDYYENYWGSGPIYARLLTIVLGAYFNSYGWSLMLCSLAIGCATAIHVYKFLDSKAA